MNVQPERPGDRTAQQGQTLVLLALGIFVLIGAMGLGVDVGRMFVERRAAQGAADSAATSTAYSRCNGRTEALAIADGLATAAANGYTNDGVTNWVTITPGGGFRFRVEIRSNLGSTFAGAVGFDSFEVGVEADADCAVTTSAVGAVYAGGNNCTSDKWGIDFPGSDARVYGGMHTNGDLSVSGSNNRFTDGTAPVDAVTYVGIQSIGGTGNVFDPGYPQDVGPSSRGWPTGWAPADFGPRATSLNLEGLAQANGTRYRNTVTAIPKNGVIWTDSTDGMDISSIAAGVDTVTLVATRGPIKISLSGSSSSPRTLKAHTDGLLMLSGLIYGSSDNCSKFTINISGQHISWNGIMWAPGGLIEIAGSDGSAVNGSFIGHGIKVSGQNLQLRFNPLLFPSGIPYIVE